MRIILRLMGIHTFSFVEITLPNFPCRLHIGDTIHVNEIITEKIRDEIITALGNDAYDRILENTPAEISHLIFGRNKEGYYQKVFIKRKLNQKK